jgi:hypothetical protein
MSEIKRSLKDSYPIIETDGDDYVWSMYRQHITSIVNVDTISKEKLQEVLLENVGGADDIFYDEIVAKANKLWFGQRQLLSQIGGTDVSSDVAVLVVRSYPEFVLETDVMTDGWKIKCRWRAAFPLVKFKGWQEPDFGLPF